VHSCQGKRLALTTNGSGTKICDEPLALRPWLWCSAHLQGTSIEERETPYRRCPYRTFTETVNAITRQRTGTDGPDGINSRGYDQCSKRPEIMQGDA